MKRLLILCSCLLLLAAAAPAADAEPRPINDVYVVHFILDGTNLKAFDDALAAGKMPTLQEHFVEKGARFTEATSVFPSTSTSVYQSYLTGLMPGHSGIPHLERFDRQTEDVIGYLTASGFRKLNSDLINLRALTDPQIAQIAPPTTIFELLEGHPTAAIYSSFSRGAQVQLPRIAPVGAIWSTYVSERVENVDVMALEDVIGLFEKPIAKVPRYTLAGLYSSDIMGHKHGPQSSDVKDMLRQFDLFLRDFLSLLQRRGIADKTYLIVSADHGMHDCGQLFRFQQALGDRGIALRPSNPRDRSYTIYAANRGVASSHLYVRRDGGFAPLTDPEALRRVPVQGGGTVDLIDFIRRLDATELLIVRAGERRARLFDREGSSAEIDCTEVGHVEYCSYLAGPGGADPLGYASDPATAKLADGRPHSTFAWRQASARTRYPDAVIGMSQIFADGRGGDLFITTRDRYGFRKVKAGNHGGPNADDMRVPLLIAGPGVPRGRFTVARPTDLYPLVLSWFGLFPSRGAHDGRDPFAPFAGDDPVAARLAELDQFFEGRPPLLRIIDAREFVRREVLPLVPAKERAAVLRLAREEARSRSELTRRLDALLKDLIAQRDRDSAPQVAPPDYLADHTAIVQRARGWAEEGSSRMQEILAALTGDY